MKILALLCIGCLFFPFRSVRAGSDPSGDVDSITVVREIRIEGNTRTRNSVIAREIPFTAGDTLRWSELNSLLQKGRENIFNTRLFNSVEVEQQQVPGQGMTDILIRVRERWYAWPVPYIRLADRNLNVWLETMDLSRITYGIDMTFFNMRGRNETMQLQAHAGYDQLIGFRYKIPFFDKKQSIGLNFGFSFARNHEIAAKTINNRQVFFVDGDHYNQKDWMAFADLFIRRGFYQSHLFHLAWHHYSFDEMVDTIPGFIIDQSKQQEFAQLNYFFKYDRRDVHYYPMNGYYADVMVNHAIPWSVARNTFLLVNLRRYAGVSGRLSYALGFTGKVSFARQQPYYLQRGLGFGRDFVRGYEYYVVDGQHYALGKTTLKFALVQSKKIHADFLKLEKFNRIPLSVYLNAYSDLGFVYKYNIPGEIQAWDGNTLQNSLLVGYGLGIDLVTYYDMVIRMEGSMNLMGECGLFLHFMAPI